MTRVGFASIVVGCVAVASACGESKRGPGRSGANAAEQVASGGSALPPFPWKAAAVAHGGLGSGPERVDGCRAAVDAALAVLEKKQDPLDAAVAGVVVMENDPRYNAGTGSRVRIDGRTVQMDAAVMTSEGRFGAVAVIENVRNPVLVARAVLGTPHLLLAGDGATRFARTLGMPFYDPRTEDMVKTTRALLTQLKKKDPALPDGWERFDWRAHWNFETSLKELARQGWDVGSDTVGVAVRASDGRFAVALSTGGTAITLRGRVGDVPVLGAGLYAGPWGAVAATGRGERIVEKSMSRRVYERMASGVAVEIATRAGLDELDDPSQVGLIAIGPGSLTGTALHVMAWAGRELGSDDWHGPDLVPEASPP